MSQPNDMIKQKLNNVGLPYEYGVYAGGGIKTPPYILYRIGREEFFGSDDSNSLKSSYVTIEFYTVKKDFDTEDKIETEFNGYKIDKNEDYNDADEVYRVTYDFSLTLKTGR